MFVVLAGLQAMWRKLRLVTLVQDLITIRLTDFIGRLGFDFFFNDSFAICYRKRDRFSTITCRIKVCEVLSNIVCNNLKCATSMNEKLFKMDDIVIFSIRFFWNSTGLYRGPHSIQTILNFTSIFYFTVVLSYRQRRRTVGLSKRTF